MPGRLRASLPARRARCRPVPLRAVAPPPYDRTPLPKNPHRKPLQMNLMLNLLKLPLLLLNLWLVMNLLLLLLLLLLPLLWMDAAAAPRPYDRTPLPKNPPPRRLRMRPLLPKPCAPRQPSSAPNEVARPCLMTRLLPLWGPATAPACARERGGALGGWRDAAAGRRRRSPRPVARCAASRAKPPANMANAPDKLAPRAKCFCLAHSSRPLCCPRARSAPAPARGCAWP